MFHNKRKLTKCNCIACKYKKEVKDCKCKPCSKCEIHIGLEHEEKDSYNGLCEKCSIEKKKFFERV